MALVDTAPKSSDCENNLRMACADELSAQVSYREIRTQIQHRDNIPSDVKEEILRRLNEIIKDEEEHTGSLLFCLNLLNSEFAKNMNNGANVA
jgi:bacterioferritin (cytochrome b1)